MANPNSAEMGRGTPQITSPETLSCLGVGGLAGPHSCRGSASLFIHECQVGGSTGPEAAGIPAAGAQSPGLPGRRQRSYSERRGGWKGL